MAPRAATCRRCVGLAAGVLAVWVLWPCWASSAAAQPPQGRVASVTPRVGPAPVRGAPVAAGTRVMGFAWTATNAPLPNAAVQLRNVTSGRVEARAVTDSSGEFVFENVEGNATYVVELLDERGRVVAVGQPFALAPGETVATFVRLVARRPWFAGWWRDTAAAVVASASSLGIAAVAPPEQPASARR